VALWQIAWAWTDLPLARCGRAVRVSVTPYVGLCCLSQPCPAVGVRTRLLAILSEPGAGMLQETDQRQAHQELSGTAAGAFSESGDDLFERVGPLTPAACSHQLLKGGTIPRDGRIEPGISCGSHIDHGAHLGVRLAQDLSGTFFYMRPP
jgi:hypothetical protein